jgi:Response regulator receiver domain.
MEVNNPDYTILIVDDVDANVLLLKLLISKAGYKTMTAFNGRDALDAVENKTGSYPSRYYDADYGRA